MGEGYFVFMGIMLLVSLGALIAFGIGVAVMLRKADPSTLAVAWLVLSVGGQWEPFYWARGG